MHFELKDGVYKLAQPLDLSGKGPHRAGRFDNFFEQNHPILVLKKSGNWYHFRDFEGDKGWIHKSLVRKIPSVITNKDKCNVRSGPGTKFEILFTIGDGIPFKILKRKGNWINVQHADGDKGWIHKSLVW